MRKIKRVDFNFVGAERNALFSLLRNAVIVAYAIPVGQTLGEAWSLALLFRGEWSLFVRSRMEALLGWDEVGRLEFSYCATQDALKACEREVYKNNEVGDFRVESIRCLVFEDDSLRCESGIVLVGLDSEITICAGISPGSISVQAPFSSIDFRPEFKESQLRREPVE